MIHFTFDSSIISYSSLFKAGAKSEQTKYLLHSTNPHDFVYLSSQNDVFDIPGVDDHEHFNTTVESMKTLNFSDSEVSNMLILVNVVLQLGNVTYEDGSKPRSPSHFYLILQFESSQKAKRRLLLLREKNI